MTPFDRALAHTLGVEGGYSDHASDSGGKTNWGVTEATARAFGYQGPMDQLPIALARQIYREQYWDSLQLDEIAFRAEELAVELFDTGVNIGPANVAKFLQRGLNLLNRRGQDYSDIPVDGLIGRRTLYALKELLNRRGEQGETVLLKMLNVLQGAYYIELAERREKDEDFIFGWFAQRVGI